MILVFVIDSYGVLTNGTTITAYRFVEALEAKGHTVRVVSVGVEGPNRFPVPERRIPIVSAVARRQSIYFGAPDEAAFRAAFAGADAVHFFMPWKLAKAGRRVAAKMGIPCTAAFHVQPENITYGAGLGRCGSPVAALIYVYFRLSFYRHFEDLHCPSAFIAGELRKHRYRAKLHVISNGVGPTFTPAVEPATSPSGKGEFFDIVMVGRYAPEKRQELIIEAVRRSRYEKRIRLSLAGAGPREKVLRRKAASLTNAVSFGFHPQPELIELLRRADLYVHAADVEIEAISCLEAIACGLVPVISDSPKSATKQFALDERSLFKAGSAADLAAKIDYWIERPEERAVAAEAYRNFSGAFRLDYSVRKAELMFREAVGERRCQDAEGLPEGRRYRRRLRKGIPLRLLSVFVYYLAAIPLLWLFLSFGVGVRIRNRKAIRQLRRLRRRRGAVTIANHVHTLDSAMVGLAAFPRKPVFTSLSENFRLPFAGPLVGLLGSVPVPETLLENRIFFYELSKLLRNGRFIHIFPEGELVRNDSALRPFKKGAFRLAVDAQVPIVPIAVSIRERRPGLRWLLRKHYVRVTVGRPLEPELYLTKREAAERLMARATEAMERLLENPTGSRWG